MTLEDPPEGQLFSRTYLERGVPVRDSNRFRTRLVAYFHQKHSEKLYHELDKAIELELGVTVPSGSGIADYTAYFLKAEVRDILDTVSLLARLLQERGDHSGAKAFITFVQRIFEEENLGYRVDAKGGVHYFVDEEFERNRVATLNGLDNPQYSGARDAYEAAYRHMDSDPLDTIAAVRSMFESLEILVRQMIPTKNLNRWIVENTLKEKCAKLYENEPTAAQVVAGLFDGFADWVNALHNYRHGQPSEQPVAPTIEVAVYVLSSGSAFLRWLIGMNNDLKNATKD